MTNGNEGNEISIAKPNGKSTKFLAKNGAQPNYVCIGVTDVVEVFMNSNTHFIIEILLNYDWFDLISVASIHSLIQPMHRDLQLMETNMLSTSTSLYVLIDC